MAGLEMHDRREVEQASKLKPIAGVHQAFDIVFARRDLAGGHRLFDVISLGHFLNINLANKQIASGNVDAATSLPFTPSKPIEIVPDDP